MSKAAVAFDMETVGLPFDDIDGATQDYLILRTQRKLVREGRPVEEAGSVARETLGLSPGTGRIISIAMVNQETEQGAILVEGTGGWAETAPDDPRIFRGDEEAMLREFWKVLGLFGRVVTYHGRGFDVPFAYIRSAIHGIKPGRNLLGNRFSINDHCDLAEVLTFFGAAQERFSLDYWCRRFGVDSPKVGGVDGSKVGEMYAAGKIEEIAQYCLRDARSTGDLYKVLEPTLIQLALNR